MQTVDPLISEFIKVDDDGTVYYDDTKYGNKKIKILFARIDSENNVLVYGTNETNKNPYNSYYIDSYTVLKRENTKGYNELVALNNTEKNAMRKIFKYSRTLKYNDEELGWYAQHNFLMSGKLKFSTSIYGPSPVSLHITMSITNEIGDTIDDFVIFRKFNPAVYDEENFVKRLEDSEFSVITK